MVQAMMVAYGPVTLGLVMACLVAFGRRWGAIGAALGTMTCMFLPMFMPALLPITSDHGHAHIATDMDCMVGGLLLAMTIVWSHDRTRRDQQAA